MIKVKGLPGLKQHGGVLDVLVDKDPGLYLFKDSNDSIFVVLKHAEDDHVAFYVNEKGDIQTEVGWWRGALVGKASLHYEPLD